MTWIADAAARNPDLRVEARAAAGQGRLGDTVVGRPRVIALPWLAVRAAGPAVRAAGSRGLARRCLAGIVVGTVVRVAAGVTESSPSDDRVPSTVSVPEILPVITPPPFFPAASPASPPPPPPPSAGFTGLSVALPRPAQAEVLLREGGLDREPA